MDNKLITEKREVMLEIHHNIRTPLNAILGFAQILINDKKITAKEKKTCLKAMQKSSIEILTNIDTILDSFAHDH